MKNLIKKDFEKMEIAFFQANEEKNIKLMRSELHKMFPIISNLKYQEFLVLIDQYKNYNQYDEGLNELNEQLKQCLAQIYIFLEES